MRGWILAEGEGAAPGHLACAALTEAGLLHAFSLKPGAGTAPRPGPPAEVLARIGLAGAPVARPIQVHGATVARPSEDPVATRPERADAVLVVGTGAAAIATADCVGAIVAATGAGAFAVVHAGWRGTIAGALPAAIRALAAVAGAPPESMIVALGPSIGGCCYEVGEEVEERFRALFDGRTDPQVFGRRGGATTLDLAAANLHQAVALGVKAANVHACGICTACREDLCWSYRRSGPRAGRMWTMAGLRAD